MSRNHFIVLCLLLLTMGAAWAEPVSYYAGIAAGMNKTRFSGDDVWRDGIATATFTGSQTTITSASSVSPVFTFRAHNAGYRLYGGARFTSFLAVEAAYVDLGRSRYKGHWRLPCTPPTATCTSFNAPTAGTLRTDGLTLGLIGEVPLAPAFFLSARIDAVKSTIRASTSNVLPLDTSPDFAKATRTRTSLGIGARYAIDASWSVRLNWQRYDHIGLGNGGVDLATLGLEMGF